jgi:hypothetical protein
MMFFWMALIGIGTVLVANLIEWALHITGEKRHDTKKHV